MMRVAFVRGAYLNEFEAQNYIFNKDDVDITGVSSLCPLSSIVPFKTVRFPSIADIGNIPHLPLRNTISKAIKYVSNRTLGDSQILYNIESLAGKFDIYHTADSHYYYSYQLAKLRLRGKISKLVMTSWETIPFNNEKIPRKKYLKNFVMKAADWAICHTQKSASALWEEGFPENKISIVRLGVDKKRFRPANKTSKKIKFLFVGRLVEEKGIVDTIDAIIRVMHALTSEFAFQIVGSGPLKNLISNKIRKNELTDRILLSEIKYQDIHTAYNSSDILIAPSKRTETWEEQYGMVFPEAMSCGLAIITSGSGAIKEVVGNAGLYLKETNAESIYKTILSIIDKPKEIDNLKQLSLARSKKYDSAKAAEEIGKIYSDICSIQK